MRSSQSRAEQTTFDFGAELAETRAAPVEGISAGAPLEGEEANRRLAPVMVASPGSKPWNEVPQPLFLSWSTAQQLAYCAARDLDATEHAESEFWVTFYRERAQSYKEHHV